jgi:hypothetical protein
MKEDKMPVCVTRRECDLSKEAIKSTINAEVTTIKAEIKALRRELALGITISTTLIGIFMGILALLLR